MALCLFFLILGSWGYATPAKLANTYDPSELEYFRAFLRQTDSEGILNINKLGLGIGPEPDTANWTTDETWVSKVIGLSWNTQTPKKITSIIWQGSSLSGTLDASAFTELHTLYCNSNLLTSLDISKNTKLKQLNCGFNRVPLSMLYTFVTRGWTSGLEWFSLSMSNQVNVFFTDTTLAINRSLDLSSDNNLKMQ